MKIIKQLFILFLFVLVFTAKPSFGQLQFAYSFKYSPIVVNGSKNIGTDDKPDYVYSKENWNDYAQIAYVGSYYPLIKIKNANLSFGPDVSAGLGISNGDVIFYDKKLLVEFPLYLSAHWGGGVDFGNRSRSKFDDFPVGFALGFGENIKLYPLKYYQPSGFFELLFVRNEVEIFAKIAMDFGTDKIWGNHSSSPEPYNVASISNYYIGFGMNRYF